MDYKLEKWFKAFGITCCIFAVIWLIVAIITFCPLLLMVAAFIGVVIWIYCLLDDSEIIIIDDDK